MGFFKKIFNKEKSLEVTISDQIYKLLKGELKLYGRSKSDLPTNLSNSNRSLGIISGMVMCYIDLYGIDDKNKSELFINCIHRVFVSVFGFKMGTINYKGVKDLFDNNKLENFPEFKKGCDIGYSDCEKFITQKDIPSEWVTYVFDIKIGPNGLSY